MPSPRDIFTYAVVGIAVTTAAGAGVLAWSSTKVGEYSVMDMGRGSSAGGEHGGHGMPAATPQASGGISLVSLTADPARVPDVRVELVARKGKVAVPGGHPVEGYTLNGSSPGPEIRARQGDLVEVTLVNASVADGATLHWHGVDVPNAADGVAGITQDVVPVGGRYVYRFVAKDAGTFWYHSHQLSHEQVLGGLLGPVVIDPVEPMPASVSHTGDVTALLHVYGGQQTLNGAAKDQRVDAEPGSTVRVRVINTDQGTASVWSDAPFRVVATDGQEVDEPTQVTGQKLLIPAGGRADVTLQAPEKGELVRLRTGAARSILIGDPDASAASARSVPQPSKTLDLLAYGTAVPLEFDATKPDRSYEYVIARRFGMIDGVPGNFWTINGQMFPNVPMFHVTEGDVVKMHLKNDSGEVHPMHLHGHHVVVLSRNGVKASGSPWRVDSLDVRPGEEYEIAFVANNPGIWSDHCHNLPHAAEGLIAHVMYDGITTPFTINGDAGNRPE